MTTASKAGGPDKRHDSGRVEWVDVCKFLSIWVVVLLHYGVPSAVDQWFHCFHMPVFFFLSGMVFDAKRYTLTRLARRRAASLLRPYVAFSLLAWLFWSVAGAMGSGGGLVSPESFARHLFWDCTDPLKELWGGIQWFLPALFITEILAFLFCKLGGWLPRLAAAALCLAISLLVARSGEVLPLALASALSMVPMFLLGNALSPCMWLLPDVPRSWRFALALACCAVVTACLLLNGAVNVREARMGNPALFLAGAIAGSILMCVTAVELDELLKDGKLREWVLYIGQNTIVVLYFHRWLQGVVMVVLSAMGFVSMGIFMGVAVRVALFLACVCLSGRAIRIVSERMPWLIGRSSLEPTNRCHG